MAELAEVPQQVDAGLVFGNKVASEIDLDRVQTEGGRRLLLDLLQLLNQVGTFLDQF